MLNVYLFYKKMIYIILIIVTLFLLLLMVISAFQALIKYLGEAHRGVQGFVMDENGFPIEKASLKIKSRDVGFQTTKYGEYWRILLPGVYKLEVFHHIFRSLKCNTRPILTGFLIPFSFYFRCMQMDIFLKTLNLWL